MKRGYFVSFEGQDGCGKSSIIQGVSAELSAMKYPLHVVDEFSTSYFGQYLLDTLAQDKFLRRKGNYRTSLTQLFAILTDWMYLTEQEIVPQLQQGRVVLKDRHIDTLIACQLPTVLEEYTMDEEQLYQWFKQTLKISPVIPDLTFYLDVPLKVRIERIKNRSRTLIEDRAYEVSVNDIKMFEARERIYKRLVQENKDRMIIFDNSGNLVDSVKQLTQIIIDRYSTFKI